MDHLGHDDGVTDGPDPAHDPLLRARALVLHDLAAYGAATADVVDLVEDVVSERRWWVEQWPSGAEFVAGQVAQDVQDRLLDTEGRWPTCRLHEDAPLAVEPELGPDPHWVCPEGCGVVAPLGALPTG
ncbi:MAG: hypothetical protein ACTHOD_03065 [Motilibacteraceae bacterium]